MFFGQEFLLIAEFKMILHLRYDVILFPPVCSFTSTTATTKMTTTSYHRGHLNAGLMEVPRFHVSLHLEAWCHRQRAGRHWISSLRDPLWTSLNYNWIFFWINWSDVWCLMMSDDVWWCLMMSDVWCLMDGNRFTEALSFHTVSESSAFPGSSKKVELMLCE